MLPCISVQVFDPTESAGLGLLNEMSLVETKARLEANERRRQEAEEIKRKEILMEKAEREADLRERHVIARHGVNRIFFVLISPLLTRDSWVD